MEVKVDDYGNVGDIGNDESMSFVRYKVSNLDKKSLNYLKKNLGGKTKIANDSLYITILYGEDIFPFRSNEAKAKIDDFIANEEIDMMVFLSSFLEDKPI